MFAIYKNTHWVEINGAFEHGDIQYPANWPQLATEEERRNLGIAEVELDYGVPLGHRVMGSQIIDVNGKPVLKQATIPLPLEEARNVVWSRVKEERERRINEGAPTPFGVFDATDTARTNVGGSVQMAQIFGADFHIEWTLHDNTTVVLNATQMIQVGVMVGQFYSAQVRRSQQIRVELADMTVEEMFAKSVTEWWDEVQ